MKREDLRLYLVTDRTLAGGRDIRWIVREAVAGGVTMVQLREKDIDTRDFVDIAMHLKRILQPSGVPLIINDRIDVALASEADGVHLGQSDMECEIARRILGPDKIIGLSVENMDQVRESCNLPVDYIGISPVFSTRTKLDTAPPFGYDGTREAARISSHPTVAIGGINENNASEVIACGVDGIAVVSAIVSVPRPDAAARSLINLMKDGNR